MSVGAPVIISAALTGVAANRKQCPAIPYTPAEIAAEAVSAAQAGAAIVHIHAREDDGQPSWRVDVFARIAELIRAESDVLLNFSTGAIGLSVEERLDHITQVRPDIGALNMGSMNYAIYGKKSRTFHLDAVFANPFRDIIAFLEAMNGAGVRPELECFDIGHVASVAPLLDLGHLRPPLQFSLIHGVLGGTPATVDGLVAMVRTLPPGANWQAIAVRLEQWPILAAALALGGHVRVGLEDNYHLARGEVADSNAALVEKAVRMASDIGRPVATVAETREILKLG